MEKHVLKLDAKYKRMQQEEVRYETYMAEDADILLVGYGIVSRVLRSAVDHARANGLKVGLFRPITLFPFPSLALAAAARNCGSVMVVEMSTGQMVEDVQLAVSGRFRSNSTAGSAAMCPRSKKFTFSCWRARRRWPKRKGRNL